MSERLASLFGELLFIWCGTVFAVLLMAGACAWFTWRDRRRGERRMRDYVRRTYG